MNIKTTISLILFLTTVLAHANMNDQLKSIGNQSEINKKSLSEASQTEIKNSSAADIAKYQALINGLLVKKQNQLDTERKGGKPADGAILFVSFSMPTDTIFALSQEADRFNIPVVIKGLVQGDFRKTLEKIAAITQEAKQRRIRFQGISIDPVWFDQFKITAVPTLVVTKRPSWCKYQKACENQPYDAVSGNIPIKKSLAIIAERGEQVPEVAFQILEKGHV